jgi:hypothetical protein
VIERCIQSLVLPSSLAVPRHAERGLSGRAGLASRHGAGRLAYPTKATKILMM